MPDWDNKTYLPLKKVIEGYINSLNYRDYSLLNELFTDKIIISRGKSVEGKEKAINLFKDLFKREMFENIKFEAIDATAGFFSSDESQIILYLEIYLGEKKKEVFIETLNLLKENGKWKIRRIFGLSLDPEDHKKYFKSFL